MLSNVLGEDIGSPMQSPIHQVALQPTSLLHAGRHRSASPGPSHGTAERGNRTAERSRPYSVMEADRWWGSKQRGKSQDDGKEGATSSSSSSTAPAPVPRNAAAAASSTTEGRKGFQALDVNGDGVATREESSQALSVKNGRDPPNLSPCRPSGNRPTGAPTRRVIGLRSPETSAAEVTAPEIPPVGGDAAASTRAGGMDLLSPSRLSSQALRDASAALAAEDLRAAGGGAGRENPLGLREQDLRNEKFTAQGGGTGSYAGSCTASPLRQSPCNGGSGGSAGSRAPSPGSPSPCSPSGFCIGPLRSSARGLGEVRGSGARSASRDCGLPNRTCRSRSPSSPTRTCSTTAPPFEHEGIGDTSELESAPPVVSRLLEAVVAEEVEGLGECLSICAQRSRTLKLLGFQHLHFDARLQNFLENRARGVVRPFWEALLLGKSLVAFREAVRHGYLWQKIGLYQGKLSEVSRKACNDKKQLKSARQRARSQLGKTLDSAKLSELRLALSGWMEAVLRAKMRSMNEKLDKAAKLHTADEKVQKLMRMHAIQERLSHYRAELMADVLEIVTRWNLHARNHKLAEMKREKLIQKVKLMMSDCRDRAFENWVEATRAGKHAKEEVQKNEAKHAALRRRQVHGIDMLAPVFRGDGAELHHILAAWLQVRKHRHHLEQVKVRVLQAFNATKSWMERTSFAGWRKHWQVTKSAEKLVARNQVKMQSRLKLMFWKDWHNSFRKAKAHRKGMLKEKQKLENERLQLKEHVITSWSRAAGHALRERLDAMQRENFNKALVSQQRAIAALQRQIAASGQQLLVMGFESFQGCTKERREREQMQARMLQNICGTADMLKAQAFRGWTNGAAAERMQRKLEELSEEQRRIIEERNYQAEEAAKDRKAKYLKSMLVHESNIVGLCFTHIKEWRNQSKHIRQEKAIRLQTVQKAISNSIGDMMSRTWSGWRLAVITQKV
eukprot:TRINITY_DN41386_c0_g1_i1.p1 TRINITY_DN41386_c0_g1~~TRINITY_DN41386_c0_g1_i1.p1  ORF type:complete len:958 (+),score=141.78 TRINITY_DN41386_c0_g1_i1:89-2962(+)